MTTRLLPALSLALVLGGSLIACAPPGTDVADDEGVDREADDLGASQRSYVTLRRDYRKCAYPMCGGWFVADVNRKNPKEQYVAALDFAGSDLDEATAGIVTSAGNGEVVLYGKLGDLADWEDPAMKTFQVSAAWRGMPGNVVTEGSIYFDVWANDPPIQCITAPCNNAHAKPLHKGDQHTVALEGVDTTFLTAEPRVDHTWLQARVATGDALVAGVIIETGEHPGGTARTLATEQVFLRLPEPVADCPQAKPACEDGEVAVWTRDADRCVVPAEDWCIEPQGSCALFVPSCAEGYTLQSWTGGPFACSVYACDPSWVVPEEAPVDG